MISCHYLEYKVKRVGEREKRAKDEAESLGGKEGREQTKRNDDLAAAG